MKARQYVLLRLIFILAICVLAVHQLRFISHVAHRPSHSFVSYYTASVLLADRKDAQLFYNDRWFNNQVQKVTPQIEEYYSPNPPTTSLLLLPIAHHDHKDARIIWIGWSALLVAGAVIGMLWMERASFWRGVMAVLIVLCYQPLLANFETGQVYGVLFVTMMVLWLAFVHRWDRLAGGLLGIIFIMKTAGLFIFPLFLIRKRYKAFVSSIVVIALIVILTLPFLGGVPTWLAFVDRLTEYGQRPSSAVTAYQTLTGFFKHHLTYHPTWNPSPLAHVPVLASLLSYTLIITLGTITLFKSRRDSSPKATFCAMIILGVIASPVSVDYHFTLLLLPILLLLFCHNRMSIWQKISFWLAVSLLTVDYPYQQAIYSDTLLSLMAYPKLIGSLILWGVCLRITRIE